MSERKESFVRLIFFAFFLLSVFLSLRRYAQCKSVRIGHIFVVRTKRKAETKAGEDLPRIKRKMKLRESADLQMNHFKVRAKRRSRSERERAAIAETGEGRKNVRRPGTGTSDAPNHDSLSFLSTMKNLLS